MASVTALLRCLCADGRWQCDLGGVDGFGANGPFTIYAITLRTLDTRLGGESNCRVACFPHELFIYRQTGCRREN